MEEEAQAPEEVIEVVEEVATLETEEVIEAETQEEDAPEASTESTTETTAEDNKSGYERRQKFKAKKEREERAEIEKENERLKEQIRFNNQNAQPQPPVQQEKYRDPNAPQLDQFDELDDFFDARDNYRDKVRDAKRIRDNQVDSFNKIEAAHIANNASYRDDVAKALVKPTPHIAQELLRSKVGPQLLQALCNDPDLAVKLNSLHPSDAIRELIELEKTVKITPAASSAPAPISTPKTSMPKGSSKFTEGQSQREFSDQRAEYIASQRKY